MNAYAKYQAKQTPLEAAKLVARDCFAWPGGYPLVLVMSDGGTLCPACIRENWRSIVYSTVHKLHDGWNAEGYSIEEGPEEDVTCDHCGNIIAEAC